MYVGQVMTRKVITIAPDETLDSVMRIMLRKKIAHLPVMANSSMVGIISDRDLRKAQKPPAKKSASRKKNGRETPLPIVSDVMTSSVHTATPTTPITDAVGSILRLGIGALPVVEAGALKGIVTKDDLLAVFLEMVRVIESSSTIDVELVDEIDDIDSVFSVLKRHEARVLNYSATPRGKDRRQICHFRLRLCPVKPIVRDLKKRGVRVLEAYGEDQ